MSTPVMKRLMREAQQMLQNPVREFVAYPSEGNLLEWHFTLRGPDESPYANGLYHGRVMVPTNYPFAPPDVVLITPNGRFELEKKICLSISSYHPENWQSTWGIATVLIALRDFMLTPGNNGIGAVEYPNEVRVELAAKSRQFKCPDCGQKVLDHAEVMDKSPPSGGATNVPATPSNPPAAAAAQQPKPSPLVQPATPNPGAAPPALSPPSTPAAQAASPSPAAGDTPTVASPPPLATSPTQEASDRTSASEVQAPQPATAATLPAGAPALAARPPPPAPSAAVPPPASPPPAAAEPPAAHAEAAAAPAAPAAALPPPAPVAPQQRVQLRRRGQGFEVQLSGKTVDAIIIVLAAVVGVLLLKKAIFDAPRPNTSTGQLVRSVWAVLRPVFAPPDTDVLADL